MYFIKVTLFVSLLYCFQLEAQVNFWHVSSSAEKTINDVGPEKMQAAWFVTGHDTVYSYRFQAGKNIARKTPFDSDTTWTANDSLYHQQESFPDRSIRLSVYFNGRAKRQQYVKAGEWQTIDHWQHDSLGKEIYHRIWNPRQMQTTINHPNGMEEWVIEHFDNDSKTIRKQHGDTNRVWSFIENDTTSHRMHWKGYMEVKNYSPLYFTRNWGDGVTQIQVVRTADFADSAISVEAVDEREIWIYRGEGSPKKYVLYDYQKVVGLKQLKSTYHFSADSDTARYRIETYAVLPNGLHRKTQELRLKKDSVRYKKIDYFWKENGTLDYLKITNRWGITRKQKPKEHIREQPADYHHPMHQHIHEEDPPRYYFQVLSENLAEIKMGTKSLDQVVVQKLAISDEREEWRWIETILFEIDENAVLTTIRRGPNSRLFTDNLKREIGKTPLQIPADLKTTFYYTDTKGKKHTKRMTYILLPATILVQRD